MARAPGLTRNSQAARWPTGHTPSYAAAEERLIPDWSGVQARDAGLSYRQIDYRVRVKRWRREARDVFGIVEWKVFIEYDSDEHHGPRYWIADDERLDWVEVETGWRMVPVDRFDLRPSTSNLRDACLWPHSPRTSVQCAR